MRRNSWASLSLQPRFRAGQPKGLNRRQPVDGGYAFGLFRHREELENGSRRRLLPQAAPRSQGGDRAFRTRCRLRQCSACSRTTATGDTHKYGTASRQTMPACSISRSDRIMAFLGASRRVDKKNREGRIWSAFDSRCSRPNRNRIAPQNARSPTGSTDLSGARRGPGRDLGHGAVHDKHDDKLNLIKYESFTRNSGGQQA
jgi:hypothetical protein